MCRRFALPSISLFVVFAILALTTSFSHGQVLTLVQSGARYAGSGAPGFNFDSGLASAVNLNVPSYIAFDATGNKYISDTQNNCVRKIDVSGSITTIVGLAVSGEADTCDTTSNPTPMAAQGLYHPTGLAIDSSNRLYIADSMHHCIRALASGTTGVASLITVAGTCGSDAAASVTPSPNGLALDRNNNLYISLQDTAIPVSQVVRHTNGAAALNVCYLAGKPSANVSLPCTGISNGVVLAGPSGLAIDAADNLFIADTGDNCVREVAGLTTQQTAVGQCSNDGSGTSATSLHNPYGLALSPTQSLFITQTTPDVVVSYVPGPTTLTPVAGLSSGVAGPYTSTQDGKAAVSTALNEPLGIAVDSFGDLSVADSRNNIIRKLSSNIIFPTTPVGSSSASLAITFVINQSANLSAATGPDFSIIGNTCTGQLSSAVPVSAPNTCQVYVRFNPTHPGLRSSFIKLTDSISGATITQALQATGTGALEIFTPGNVDTVASNLAAPTAITVDIAGNAYLLTNGPTPGTASIQLIPASGSPMRTALTLGSNLAIPSAFAVDATGNWFVVDATHGTVARFTTDGSINTNYVIGLDNPTALAVDGFGNLVIAQAGASHNVIEIYATGTRRIIAGNGSNTSADGVLATAARFASPAALSFDRNGILYVADTAGHLVYSVDNSGYIHQVAGNGTTGDTLRGKATGTALIAPSSLAVDAAGDIYIADTAANRIYTVYASSDNIASILGTGIEGYTGDGGIARFARINHPLSIAIDADANLFVVDSGNNSIRKITYPSPTLQFGSVNVGNTSTAVARNLSNFGTNDLVLTAPISISDSHFTLDANSTTCGTTISPGSSCALGFVFHPTAEGPLSATSTPAAASSDSRGVIQLTGTGNSLDHLQFTLAPETEFYGQSFVQTINIGIAGATPTGTITFTTGSQTLCTYTGTFTATTTCNAYNSGLPVGTYPVTFAYSGDGKYASASGTTTLTVGPAPLTIAVANATRTYGQTNPTFTGTITGTVSTETILVSYSSTANINSTVGTHPITATLTPVGSASLANYTVTNNPAILTVTPAPLTVTAANVTRPYGAANPTFTGTLTGLINGDAITSNFVTTANITSPAGTYSIVPSINGPAASNYSSTMHPGTLDIVPAATTTTLRTSNAAATVGASVTFTASITSATIVPAGTVTFSDGDTILGTTPLNANGIATFATSTLAVGNHTIKAALQTDSNFTASAGTLSQVIASSAGGFTLTASQSSQFAKASGATTYQVTLTSVGSFAGQVALSCSGLPAGATCTFGSNPTLTAGGTITTTMVVTTTPATAKLTQPTTFSPATLAPLTAAAVFPVEITGLGVFFAGIRRRKTLGSQQMRVLLIIAFTFGVIGLTGCGTSSAALKTYTINVTATSVAQAAPAQTTSVVLSLGNE